LIFNHFAFIARKCPFQRAKVALSHCETACFAPRNDPFRNYELSVAHYGSRLFVPHSVHRLDAHRPQRRRKTGQLLRIKWENEMRRIVRKYDTGGSPYLLPIIKDAGVRERRQYETALHLVNSKLKTIAKMAGLSVNLTMYVGRHSWASAAQSKNVPIAVISEGMGHESESTTQIYLNSIDASVVDRANRTILRELSFESWLRWPLRLFGREIHKL